MFGSDQMVWPGTIQRAIAGPSVPALRRGLAGACVVRATPLLFGDSRAVRSVRGTIPGENTGDGRGIYERGQVVGTCLSRAFILESDAVTGSQAEH
jgi:hypothetical protein